MIGVGRGRFLHGDRPFLSCVGEDQVDTFVDLFVCVCVEFTLLLCTWQSQDQEHGSVKGCAGLPGHIIVELITVCTVTNNSPSRLVSCLSYVIRTVNPVGCNKSI